MISFYTKRNFKSVNYKAFNRPICLFKVMVWNGHAASYLLLSLRLQHVGVVIPLPSLCLKVNETEAFEEKL